MKGQRTFVVVVLALWLAGCSVDPWVPPYERGLLTEPMMQFNRDPLATRYREHVYEVREGARGAGLESGVGCGCN